MTGSRPWTPDDRTGGPLDDILGSARTRFPGATVTRLVGNFQADDDNVSWVHRTGIEVQIDTNEAGTGPFIVEGAAPGSRVDTDDPVVAAESIHRLLEPIADP